MYLLVFSVVWVRWTFPRTQFYGLLNLSWKILIPVSLFTLLLSSALMKIDSRMKNALIEIIPGSRACSSGCGSRWRVFQAGRHGVLPVRDFEDAARFRGHIELVRDPHTGQPKCFVCKLCEKACPSDCITVEGVKPEGAQAEDGHDYRAGFHQMQPVRLLR